MKYKVKNRKTGEKTICEKVVVDGYDFYYTKEFPKNGDYGLTKQNGITRIGYGFEFRLYKKVIATNDTIESLPKVIDKKTYQYTNEDMVEFLEFVVFKFELVKNALKNQGLEFSNNEIFQLWQEQRVIKIEVE